MREVLTAKQPARGATIDEFDAYAQEVAARAPEFTASEISALRRVFAPTPGQLERAA